MVESLVCKNVDSVILDMEVLRPTVLKADILRLSDLNPLTIRV